jgi:DNA repair exonuclease SbcCD nuclease subunit
MLSFLHAADLHLGMRITRFEPSVADKVREARLDALDKIRQEARGRGVDFVLIAGDLFDDSAVDALTARRAFEMLDDLPMPVHVLPGNHDPLLQGGVWDRTPWNVPGKSVRLLRESQPLECGRGAMLYPCPVLRKTSLDDPTAWIAGQPRGRDKIRIGIAHGSLKTREDLPLDDHLIDRFAADDLGLDYLALGHWHGRNLYADRAGIDRTAYPGVHEPMRFQGNTDGLGWQPYSGAGREEFLDSGKGEVLHVKIAGPGEPPAIEPVEVGVLMWHDETRQLANVGDLERLIQDIAVRPNIRQRLLRLRLCGVLDAAGMLRLDELRTILRDRYFLGELDETALHPRPTDEEMREAAGQGVLRRVLDALRAESESTDPDSRQVAERAVLLLYQIAKEAKT